MRTLPLLVALCAGPALATPTSIVWVNGTDVQGHGTVHLGIDDYVAVDKDAGPLSAMLGLTFGYSIAGTLNVEIGADYLTGASSPLLLNAKVGMPESEGGRPALALGVYGVGIDAASGYHVTYLAASKSLGAAGRLTLGGFYGLGDPDLFGGKDIFRRAGLIVAYERTMTEISENLWIAADLQTGKSAFGAASAGFAWKFAPNASVLVAYNHMLDKGLPDTVYVALDADISLWTPRPAAAPTADAEKESGSASN